MDKILLFKKDLQRYPTSKLEKLRRYYHLPNVSREDLIWLLALQQSQSPQKAEFPQAGLTQSIATDVGFSAGILADGTVDIWGDNPPVNEVNLEEGEHATNIIAGNRALIIATNNRIIALGNPGYQRNIPTLPEGTSVVQLGIGYFKALALLSNGKVLGWGLINTDNQGYLPVEEPVAQIAAGGNFTLLLLQNGELETIGDTFPVFDNPPLLPEGTEIKQIVSNRETRLALLDDGSIQSWHTGFFRGLPDPPEDIRAKYIAIDGTYAIAVTEDDQLVTWGDPVVEPAQLPEGTTPMEISITENHGLALLNTGEVLGWGREESGGTSDEGPFLLPSSGHLTKAARFPSAKAELRKLTKRRPLTSQQEKYCRCTLEVASRQPIECLKDRAWYQKRKGQECYNPYAVCAASIGTTHPCGDYYDFQNLSEPQLKAYAALSKVKIPKPFNKEKMIDNIMTWKKHKNDIFLKEYREAGKSNKASFPRVPFQTISGGQNWGVAIMDDQQLYFWGKPTPIIEGSFVQVATGSEKTIALTEDGQVKAWNLIQLEQRIIPPPPSGHKYIQISAGETSFLALLDDGRIFGNDEDIPTGIYKQISTSGDYILAVTNDDKIVHRGFGAYGLDQVPEIPEGRSIVQICAGLTNAGVLLDNGEVVIWGIELEENSLQDVPTFPSPPMQIAIGNDIAIAVLEDGRTVFWGDENRTDFYQEVIDDVAEGVSAVQVFANSHQFLILLSDGRIIGFEVNLITGISRMVNELGPFWVPGMTMVKSARKM